MTTDGSRAPGRVTAWFRALPRVVRGVVGIVAVGLGVVTITRPTTSLGLLALLIGAGLVLSGILELVSRADDADLSAPARPARRHAVRALLWIAAGVVVLLWPGLTVRALAVVVGVVLIVNGALSTASAFRRGLTADARIAAVALGLAEVVFGGLALLWPDITLLVVAVVFGARLVIAGLVELWDAVRGRRRRSSGPVRPPGVARRWIRTTAALAAVVLAVGAAALSASLHGGSPVVDDFYAAPRTVPAEPGRLIRSEPFTREIPANARAWRILYTTTHGDGSPAVASGLVVVPRDGEGPWPVVDWTHGTTGFAQNCAPSLAAQPFESGAFFLLGDVIDNGWALVATDHIGLGTVGPHPYLIGPDSAHATLDAARAARQLEAARLGDQDVVWGHSQGGGAALWTGALASSYAPDVDIEGVAALAPASDLVELVHDLTDILGGSVFASFVFDAYTDSYPDVRVRDYIRPGAEVTVREMATRCLAGPGALVSVLGALALSRDPDIFSKDPATGPLGGRLADNVPPPLVTAPLLIAQGADDGLVTEQMQNGYVTGLCDAGRDVDYRVYAGRSHVPLVEPDSPLVPDLLAWTGDRFAGQPAQLGCLRRG